jgi:hypothetical protein
VLDPVVHSDDRSRMIYLTSHGLDIMSGPGVLRNGSPTNKPAGAKTMDDTTHATNLAKMLPPVTMDNPEKPLVVMIGADKGGVGKTTVSRTFDDYLQSKRATRKVYDTQYPNGDLRRFIPTASIVDIANVDHQMQVFDTLDGITVIDIRGGAFATTLRDLQKTKLLDDVRLGRFNLAILHVIGESVASLEEIGEATKTLGNSIQHYLVKNYINEGGFTQWNEDSRFAELLHDAKSRTINIPHLEASAASTVQKLGLSFDSYIRSKESRMLRGYVEAWLDAVYAEYDRVGLGRLIGA